MFQNTGYETYFIVNKWKLLHAKNYSASKCQYLRPTDEIHGYIIWFFDALDLLSLFPINNTPIKAN